MYGLNRSALWEHRKQHLDRLLLLEASLRALLAGLPGTEQVAPGLIEELLHRLEAAKAADAEYAAMVRAALS